MRKLLAALIYEDLTQTEARKRLKAVAADLPKPRVIHAESDGRERLTLVYRALKSVLKRAA